MKRAMRLVWLISGAWLLACAGLALGAPKAAKAPENKAGGTMNATLTKLGDLEPTKPGAKGNEEIDGRPIVLWAGSEPAAVLAYRKHDLGLGAMITQEFVNVGPGRRWSVSHHVFAPLGLRSDNELDGIAASDTMVGDVNGDGVEELVVLRTFGSLEVWAPGKRIFTYGGASANPKRARYELRSHCRARLPGRDELYLLYSRQEFGAVSPKELTAIGAGEPYSVLRIDQRGVSRVFLQGLEGALAVSALGAVNRPGSKEVDELLAVSVREEEGKSYAYLSRHTRDGAAIGAPRKLYDGYDPNWTMKFAFATQSDRAVAHSASNGRVFFFAPEKPVNWMRSVNLSAVVPVGESFEWFGSSEAGAKIKAVVLVHRRELYAVDEEGTFFGMQGGAWVEQQAKKPAPYFKARPPGPAEQVGVYELVGLFPAGDSADEFLVAYARHTQARMMPDEEQEAAARRFLSKEQIDRAEFLGRVSMDPDADIREKAIQQELRDRGLSESISSVEDWMRLAPRSYEDAAKFRQETFRSELSESLFEPLSNDNQIPNGCPEPEAYRAWLTDLTLPASTSAVLLRRLEHIASLDAAIAPLEDGINSVPGPSISYRSRDRIVNAVLAVSGPPESPTPGGFYDVRSARGAR